MLREGLKEPGLLVVHGLARFFLVALTARAAHSLAKCVWNVYRFSAKLLQDRANEGAEELEDAKKLLEERAKVAPVPALLPAGAVGAPAVSPPAVASAVPVQPASKPGAKAS